MIRTWDLQLKYDKDSSDLLSCLPYLDGEFFSASVSMSSHTLEHPDGIGLYAARYPMRVPADERDEGAAKSAEPGFYDYYAYYPAAVDVMYEKLKAASTSEETKAAFIQKQRANRRRIREV